MTCLFNSTVEHLLWRCLQMIMSRSDPRINRHQCYWHRNKPTQYQIWTTAASWRWLNLIRPLTSCCGIVGRRRYFLIRTQDLSPQRSLLNQYTNSRSYSNKQWIAGGMFVLFSRCAFVVTVLAADDASWSDLRINRYGCYWHCNKPTRERDDIRIFKPLRAMCV